MSAMMKRLLPLLLLGLFAAAPAHAQLRSHNLRFVPPSDSRVVGFHVYISANSMSYADWRDNVNFVPPVDQSGAASYALTGLESADDVYISMKSYDALGQESSFSNEIVLAAVQACLTEGCNDNNPCTRDTCGTNGCTFDPRRCWTTCNDGNARPSTTSDLERSLCGHAASATSTRTARRRPTSARPAGLLNHVRGRRRARTAPPAAMATPPPATTSASRASAGATPAAPTGSAATARRATAPSAA
jgi:hypothetical protein